MKFSKFQLLSDVTAGFGIAGTLAIIIGGGSCLGGLTATGVIKAGELLSNNRLTYQKMMFYGVAGSGAGLFLIATGAATALLRDKAGEEVIRRIDARYQERRAEYESERDRLSGCAGCKFWHGRTYEGNFLACTVHPRGKENCPDWEPNTDD